MKNQQRYLLYIAGILLPLITIIWCCTKPTKDFIINVNSDIITYKATFDFTDARTGRAPAGLTVSLTGADAAVIYDYSGTKALKLLDGRVTVGVHPHNNPAGTAALSFNIVATADNYLPVNIPVTIGSTNHNQNFSVPLINIDNPPDGVATREQNNAITSSTTPSAITVSTSTNATTTASINLIIPAGTQLRNAANATIAGSSVNSVLSAFDPAQPLASVNLPGGSVQTNISGGPSSSLVFQPAGFATVILKVGNTEVKNFSQPVTVQLGLNATTYNPVTNAVIKAGDVLDIYSYQVETGVWKYESTATITSSSGRLFANFQVNHLCSFLAHVRNPVQPCSNVASITFNAPQINPNSSEQFILDITPAGLGNNAPPVLSQYITLHDKDVINFRRITAGAVNIKVSVVDYDHYKLHEYRNRGAQVGSVNVNICAAGQSTTVPINYAPGTYLTGTGAAVCPNNPAVIFLPPDGAQVYYRKSGTRDQYRILGTIVNQGITTTQLVTGQRYDLNGNYSGKMVGRSDVLIRTGVSFLDSTVVINSGSSFCQ
ncbi:hypothetical protein HNQ91_002804 [Filimonas zeae]|uniref:Calx-beta domain-containing protein n=1 Tax=Filimonas zeae TaxID=1737353 RepID=A0A917IZ58_9BACT|nr:hypothetical protein [Filimonas zeae]MDR6339739.1 hypothetical protein [Filimonas zeae]GGH69412.1 hypothetical protein GCM10011379_26690 [Filimonas zeae]